MSGTSTPTSRERTMAELKTELSHEDEGEHRTQAEPGDRDDELLADPPKGEHHLGRFGGWRAAATPRWIIGGSLGLAALIGVIAFLIEIQEMQRARLHPLPEVEATIRPGSSREMSLSEGRFRVGLSREAPAINILHLPDRDITLAPRTEKAQFKVVVSEGRTREIKLLTGAIQEQLTQPGAEPLLDD